MSPEVIGIIGLVIVIVLLFLRMPIGLVLILVGFLGLAYLSSVKAAGIAVATTLFDIATHYSFTVIPVFVLMGAIASNSGMSQRMYDCLNKWIGHIRGGLAIASIGGCAGFAAICGSSAATTATMCKVAFPEMDRYGYKPELSAGSIATGGTLGILIPPSLGFIIYAIITETSIGKLFIAGIIPGILHASLYMIVIMVWTWRDPSVGPPTGTAVSIQEKLVSLKGIVETLILFIVVIGGLYTGLFTPTEAGSLGAAGAALVALARRSLTWKQFLAALSDTVSTTAMLILLMTGGFVLSRFVALSGVAQELASFIAGLPLSPIAIIGIIILTYLLLGCVLDVLTMIVVTVPIFFPLTLTLGFDPIWFGVLIVVIMEIAAITPPIGLGVWLVSGMLPQIPMQTIFKGVLIFLSADLAIVTLLVAFPQLALFLPSTM